MTTIQESLDREFIRLKGFIAALLLLSIAVPGSDVKGQVPLPGATAEKEVAGCEAAMVRLQTGMAAVFRDFDTTPVPRPLETLVRVDGRIRALLDQRPSHRPCGNDLKIYDGQWKQMGVATGYWDELVYSGQLLVEAHQRDPHSALRRYTLFSTVFGGRPARGLGVMPDISAAFAYAAEFPDGPFSTDAYRTIADFHKDLFMVLRDRRSDYKFDCYQKYIGADAWPSQQAIAKRTALEYYGRLLDLSPRDQNARRYSDEVATEVVKGWSFCAD